MITTLLARFREHSAATALICNDRAATYTQLLSCVDDWETTLNAEDIAPGETVGVASDFCTNSVALILALINMRCIVVPLAAGSKSGREDYLKMCGAQRLIEANPEGHVCHRLVPQGSPCVHVIELRKRGTPGLILFSSGSSGAAKGIVLDFALLLERYRKVAKPIRALAFLLFDHIGGINTLLSILSGGGCIVTVADRTPDSVCRAIAQHKVQVLPASPSFLNLVLLSRAYERHDLASLEVITYGTEAMPPSTLARLRGVFPAIKLKQTYGLSEVGILSTQSRDSNSLWMRIGGDGYETRVVNGLLEIQARSAMLGYINAPSPFTADGWFQTGDAVEVDGEFFRVLGRRSELINVGGLKVYPAEVEGLLESLTGVDEAVVSGEPHAILGQVVVATVRLGTDESGPAFKKRMRNELAGVLEPFKIPQKVVLAQNALHGDRFKKVRHALTTGAT